MKITVTVVIDGKTNAEYEQIKARLEAEKAESPGWTLHPEPLANRMTAVKTEEVQSL